MKKLILGSKSPRRKEILTACGFEFEVYSADADESIDETNPAAMVEQLSERKAKAVWESYTAANGQEEEIIVLGSDTVVSYEDRILGKPKNRTDAYSMISMLQGNTHQVFTGVTLLWQEAGVLKQATFAEKTDVTFYPMSEAEIKAYVSSGECDDKAGAYAVQGLGMRYIQKLNGEYHTVVGLPAAALYQAMRDYDLL